MLELTAYIRRTGKPPSCRAGLSLSAVLEVRVGNYFVSGEGGGLRDFHWLTIYYDPAADPETEAVEMVPANIVAYVSWDYRWGFVLNRHLPQFLRDTSAFDITCVPVPDFARECLQCGRRDLLPPEFAAILWLDDDFMGDETIPFDYDGYALIDEGAAYLNPKHFSALGLIRMTGGRF